ncbi:uncharacterized protein METZ01_LOCUS254492, partial [marine metagenome]
VSVVDLTDRNLMKSFSALLSFFSLIAGFCFVVMTGVSSAQSGGVDSISPTGGGAVLACTGYSGRVDVAMSYQNGVDYDSGAGEYAWLVHPGGGWNVSLDQANGPRTVAMQYIVQSGTSGSTALDGSPRIEIDGNWVSIAYELHRRNNGVNSALIGAKRIAFNCSTGELDSDFDKVYNSADNCPSNANADQSDIDGDTQGDACDTDDDGDGVADASDNCPSVVNADQANLDGDTQGDACDTDDDGDGVADASDNCPSVVNADQADADGDTQGDVCDSSPNPEEPTPVPVEGDGGDEQDDETDDNETDDNETDDNETVEEPLNTTDDESETSENSGSDEQTSEGSEGNNDSSGTRSSD